MSTFVFNNVTNSNIHAVLALTYADWWAANAKAAGLDVPDAPRVSGKQQNVFWYLNPPEAYALQIGYVLPCSLARTGAIPCSPISLCSFAAAATRLMYATVWLGAVGWDILSTISFDLRLVRQTSWKSFPSAVHSTGYLLSRYSTLTWLTVTICNLVIPTRDCMPPTRAAGFAFALSTSSIHLIFMMRTISIWNINHRVILTLLPLWLIIVAGSLVLAFSSRAQHIPGSFFCTGYGNKAFEISELCVLSALFLFDLSCLILTLLKLNKLGVRGMINGFIPRQKSHYDAEDWADMLVHRTTIFCLVQFALLAMFVILNAIPSLAPYRSMQVIATCAIGTSMAGRIFRQSWRLTREHSPANANRPPSYYPGWAEDDHHHHQLSGSDRPTCCGHQRPCTAMTSGTPGPGSGGAGGLGSGGELSGGTLSPPVPLIAKMPCMHTSPMSGDGYTESYVEGEFKVIKPFLLPAGTLGISGVTVTVSGLEAGLGRQDGGQQAGTKKKKKGANGLDLPIRTPIVFPKDHGSEANGAWLGPEEVALTPAERYAAAHSGRGKRRGRRRLLRYFDGERDDAADDDDDDGSFASAEDGADDFASVTAARSVPLSLDGRRDEAGGEFTSSQDESNASSAGGGGGGASAGGRHQRHDRTSDEIQIIAQSSGAGSAAAAGLLQDMLEVRSTRTCATGAERSFLSHSPNAALVGGPSRWSLTGPGTGTAGSSGDVMRFMPSSPLHGETVHSSLSSSSQLYRELQYHLHHLVNPHRVPSDRKSILLGSTTANYSGNFSRPGTGTPDASSQLRFDLSRRKTFPTLWAEANVQQAAVAAVTAAEASGLISSCRRTLDDPASTGAGAGGGPGATIGESSRTTISVTPAMAAAVAAAAAASGASLSAVSLVAPKSYDKSSLSPPSTATTSRPSSGTQALPFGSASARSCGSESSGRLGTPNNRGSGGGSGIWDLSQLPPHPGADVGAFSAAAALTSRQLEKRRSFLASPPLAAGPIPSQRSRMVYDFKALKEASEMEGTPVELETTSYHGHETRRSQPLIRLSDLDQSTGSSATRALDGVVADGLGDTSRPKTAPSSAVSKQLCRLTHHPTSSSALSSSFAPDPKMPTVHSSGQSTGSHAASQSPDHLRSHANSRMERYVEDEDEELDAQSAFRQVVDQDADARTVAASPSNAGSLGGRRSHDLTEFCIDSPDLGASSALAPSAGMYERRQQRFREAQEDDSADSVFAFSIDREFDGPAASAPSAAAEQPAEVSSTAVVAHHDFGATAPSAPNAETAQITAVSAPLPRSSSRPGTAATLNSASACGATDDGRPRTSRGGPVHTFGAAEKAGSESTLALTRSVERITASARSGFG
ncbi:hypothetical protein V8E36_005178 [Tilletia maclaganii]